jgi:formylglycine-generating enzyme required for sulfatase activity
MRAALVFLALAAVIFAPGCDDRSAEVPREKPATGAGEQPINPQDTVPDDGPRVTSPPSLPTSPDPARPGVNLESLEQLLRVLADELAEARAAKPPREDLVRRTESLLQEVQMELRDLLMHDLFPALRDLEADRDRQAGTMDEGDPAWRTLLARIQTMRSTVRRLLPLLYDVLTEADRERLGYRDYLNVLDLGGGVKLNLVLIPAGNFMMGSTPEDAGGWKFFECPQRGVTLTKPFYMGVFEVTQAQYEAVMGANPSQFKGVDLPVEKVSWDDAAEFCKKLSEKTGRTVRLATEAEWEYACRAGSQARFSFGDDEEPLPDHAWYRENSGEKTHPVGQKRPNAWGLYDMHGNVGEWVSDWLGSYRKAATTDPTGPATGGRRVLRGGSYRAKPAHFRSAFRNYSDPDDRWNSVGFRVVVEKADGE